MKSTFKFFQWRIKLATAKLGEEEKAKYLANELLKSVQKCGKEISLPDIEKGYGSLDIHVLHYGEKNSKLKIGNILNDWEILGKPNFKMEVSK